MDNVYENWELYSGAIGKSILMGVKQPLSFYSDNHCRGVLVIGLLVAPLFLLLGENYIVLKLVALLFSLLTLIFLWFFTRHFFNPRVAFLSATLFLFAPPSFTKLSLISLGTHRETILFTIITFYLFYILFNKGGRFSFREFVNPCAGNKNCLYLVLLGLICGLGLFFSYTYLTTFFSILLLWFLLDKKFFLRKSICFFLSGSVASLSLFLLFLDSGKGLLIQERPPWGYFFRSGIPTVFNRIKEVVVTGLMDSFRFKDIFFIPGKVIDAFYYLIFVIALLWLLWMLRRDFFTLLSQIYPFTRRKKRNLQISAETPLFFPIFIFFLVYAFSDFRFLYQLRDLDTRIFMPLYPFIFVIIALFLDRIRARKYQEWFRGGVVTLIIIGSLGNTYSLISPHTLKRNMVYKGYSYKLLFSSPRSGRTVHSVPQILKSFDRIPEEEKWIAFRNLFYEINLIENLDETLKVIKKIEEKYRGIFHESLFYQAATAYQVNSPKGLKFIDEVEDKYRHYYYLGFANGIIDRVNYDITESIQYISELNKELKPYCYEGLGRKIIFRRCHRWKKYKTKNINMGIIRDIKLIKDIEIITRDFEKVNEVYRESFYRGIAGIYNDKFEIDAEWFCDMVNNCIEEKYRPFCFIGLGRAIYRRYGYDINKCLAEISLIDNEYRKYAYIGLGEEIGRAYYDQRKMVEKWVKGIEKEYIDFFYQGLENIHKSVS